MKYSGILFFILISLLTFHTGNCQSDSIITNIVLTVNNEDFSWRNNKVEYQNEKMLAFKVQHNKEYVAIKIHKNSGIDTPDLKIISSDDYEISDSLRLQSDGSYAATLILNGLLYHERPVLKFISRGQNGEERYLDFALLPLFNTMVMYQEETIDMLQEEEKVIEIPSDASFNIVAEDMWNNTQDYDYKISNSEGRLILTIKPHSLGFKQLTLGLKTIKPIINSKNEITRKLQPIQITFNVKPNFLYFINAEKKTIYLDAAFKGSQDIQIDYNRNISLKKVYRIEDEQEGGGNLIAELYTISLIENSSKIICRIKPYSMHKISEGYLYLKEGERARFLTNFNILEKPKIDKISIMHEGQAWNNNLAVHPGESIDLKIEGKGLDNTSFYFDGCTFQKDTSKASDEVVFFHLEVPLKNFKKSNFSNYE